MPTPTYDLIASNVLTSSASSVTFSSIPGTYRDLVLVVTKPSGDYRVSLQFNSDSTASYAGVSMQGTGSAVQSLADPGSTYVWSPLYNSGGSALNISIFQIMDYANTDKHKTVLCRTSIPSAIVSADVWRWAKTNAITSIYVEPDLPSGTSLHLYGIVS